MHFNTPVSLLVALVVLSLFIVRAVYLIYYHPYARYPGPILARLTGLYAGYHGLIGDLHVDMNLCHQKYGDFVRYGPNKLLINSPYALHDIYGFKKNVKKSRAYLPLVPNKTGWSTLTAIDKDLHRSKRRLLSHGLSHAALRCFEHSMIQHMDLFLEQIGSESDQASEEWSRSLDVNVLCKWLTLDIMAEFAFGESTQLIKKKDNRFLVDAINVYLWRMGCFEECPALERLDCILLFYLWACGKLKLVAKFTAWKESFGRKILAQHGGTKGGIFSLILDADKNERQQYTESEIWAEGIFLMLAGSDTSTTAMSAMLFYLSRYPHAYERLAEEIRQRFSEASEITSSGLVSCSYLHACITEALRMAPPAPGSAWREVESGGIVVADKFIPQGLNIGTSVYAIHHREDIFESPFEFRPERWLLSSEKQLELMYQAYNPFSLGPRGCAGRALALDEVSLLVSKVLWLYDFRIAEGEAGLVGSGNTTLPRGRNDPLEYQIESHVTALSKGPMLTFKKRA